MTLLERHALHTFDIKLEKHVLKRVWESQWHDVSPETVWTTINTKHKVQYPNILFYQFHIQLKFLYQYL